MSASRFWKRKPDDKLSNIEEKVSHSISDYESFSPEAKQEVKDLYIDSIKEIEVTSKGKKKTVVLIVVPFVCHKVLARVQKKVTPDIEKRVKH